MKICIPTQDERGMESELFGHFGSAPFFTVVDSESGEVEVRQNDNTHHGRGGCHPLRQFGSHSVDAVVCQGMGRRAIASLKEAGVRVLVLGEGAGHTVQGIVAAAREGRLRPLSEEDACRGHGDGRGHGHRHGPGGCQGSGPRQGGGKGCEA
jgi:predicted Fe-Mo cluster-binding NifX family protein